jgi:uncharacterized membrane protein
VSSRENPRAKHKAGVVLLLLLRCVVITFLITILAFAIALFLGISGIVAAGLFRGGGVNLVNAYRHVAAPAALVVLIAAFVVTLVYEVRYYRREQQH